MADEKAVTEAIDNLCSMFSEIDKETITDIFLGCKKDFDATIDQLIGMGAEQDKKSTPVTPSYPVKPTSNTNSPLIPSAHLFPSAPNVPSSPVPVSTPQFTDSPAEKERLEALNLQLSQEYRRLADTQEKNMLLERQLSTVQSNFALERQRFEEEKRRFEDEKALFQQDKKRLEEHLSSRLREMKEQMRRSEEEAKVKDEEKKRDEAARLEEERAAEEEARIAEKELKRQSKLRIKEEKKAQKAKTREAWFQEEQARMEQHSAEQHSLIERMRDECSTKVDALKAENEALRLSLEQMEHSVVVNQQSTQDGLVEALQAITGLLSKTTEDLQQKSVNPATLKEELLKSLRNAL